jgi:hypothetical protein
MRRDRIERAALIVVVALLLVGCIPVPVPTRAAHARYSEEKLATLVPGSTTRDAVEQALGRPDIRRAKDRLWIYEWSVDSSTGLEQVASTAKFTCAMGEHVYRDRCVHEQGKPISDCIEAHGRGGDAGADSDHVTRAAAIGKPVGAID